MPPCDIDRDPGVVFDIHTTECLFSPDCTVFSCGNAFVVDGSSVGVNIRGEIVE